MSTNTIPIAQSLVINGVVSFLEQIQPRLGILYGFLVSCNGTLQTYSFKDIQDKIGVQYLVLRNRFEKLQEFGLIKYKDREIKLLLDEVDKLEKLERSELKIYFQKCIKEKEIKLKKPKINPGDVTSVIDLYISFRRQYGVPFNVTPISMKQWYPVFREVLKTINKLGVNSTEYITAQFEMMKNNPSYNYPSPNHMKGAVAEERYWRYYFKINNNGSRNRAVDKVQLIQKLAQAYGQNESWVHKHFSSLVTTSSS